MLKSLFHSMLLVLSLYGTVYADTQPPANTLNSAVLDLPITLTSGQTVTLKQFKDHRPVYLKFWASYCRDCLGQMRHLQQLQQKYGDRIQIIAVNLGVNEDPKSIVSIQKKYGLRMPVAVDKSGKLAEAFNLMATPYHVMLDKSAHLVYTEYLAPKDLDIAIQSLAEGRPLHTAQAASAPQSPAFKLDALGEKPTALYFVSTWCDWYLKDSHPDVSKSCIASQMHINQLVAKYPKINWVGVATRLWTEEKDVADYRNKFKLQYPLTIDNTNAVFLAYDVKDFPTLILLDKGKEIYRTRQIDPNKIAFELQKLSPNQSP